MTPYDGATAGTPATASGSATSAVVTGLANGTAYTFKVVASNGQGDGPASSASNVVTPATTIFDFATPATIDGGDNSSIVLGAKFTADTDGWITGIRFYKAAANTGTHIGALYSVGRLGAGAGNVQRRERLRLADGVLRQPAADHGGHDVPRDLPGAQRPLLGDRRGVRQRRSTIRRCTPSPTPRRPTASTPTAAS